MENRKLGSLFCATIIAAGGYVSAGEFDGVALRAKLIGGQQYEALYGRIAEWEAETGATIEILSKKKALFLNRMPFVPPKNAFGYKPLIIKLKFLPPDVVILIYSVGYIAKHAIYEQS